VLQFLFFAPAFVGGFLFHKTLLSSNSISSRLAFWKHAFNQFLDSPLFGDGLGLLYPIYHGKLLPHAHNFYLSVLGEMGLVGASCMLLIGMTTIAARKKLSTSTRTALFALLIWNLFDEPFYWLLPVTVTAILLSRERETVKGSNS
jgi:O-antigen ligase